MLKRSQSCFVDSALCRFFFLSDGKQSTQQATGQAKKTKNQHRRKPHFISFYALCSFLQAIRILKSGDGTIGRKDWPARDTMQCTDASHPCTNRESSQRDRIGWRNNCKHAENERQSFCPRKRTKHFSSSLPLIFFFPSYSPFRIFSFSTPLVFSSPLFRTSSNTLSIIRIHYRK